MERVLVVSNSNELVRMKPERIAYISSDGNYVTVVLHDRTEHVFAFNLLRMQKLVETQLAEEAACFIRIGKSLIINATISIKSIWRSRNWFCRTAGWTGLSGSRLRAKPCGS